MYNLNHPEVRRRFSRAVSLGGYLHFIDRVKELKEGKMLTEEMIDRAINECIEQGILADFFREHRKEIKNTMIIDETYENRLRLERLENERERVELGEEYEKRLELERRENKRELGELSEEYEKRLELERQENKRELGELSEEYEKRLELERNENEKRLELVKQEAERKAERQAVEVMKRTLGNLMETMQLTAEQAMDALLIPPEERQKYRG